MSSVKGILGWSNLTTRHVAVVAALRVTWLKDLRYFSKEPQTLKHLSLILLMVHFNFSRKILA